MTTNLNPIECAIEGIGKGVTVESHAIYSFPHDLAPLSSLFPLDGDTPTIPEHVYEQLPNFLKRIVLPFKDKRTRDMVLTAALATISGCIDNVTGIYDGKPVHANLYAIALARFAQGKGNTRFVRMLAEAIDERLNKDYEQKRKEYKVAERQYKKAEEDVGSVMLPPEEPIQKLLLIPGNSSASAFLHSLNNNDGKGVLFETEADVMGTMFKNDWSSYSTALRQAYHHEPISQNRLMGGQFHITNPRLSLFLTGTPDQFPALAKSAEDGLYSRYTIYFFDEASVWRTIATGFNDNVINLKDYFAELSHDMLKVYNLYNERPLSVYFSSNQHSYFNAQFKLWNSELMKNGADEYNGIEYRHALQTFRFALILTALRHLESTDSNVVSTEVSDIDFTIAHELIKVYFAHSLLMFQKLPKTSKSNSGSPGDFLQKLPSEFSTATAVELGIEMKLSQRTVYLYLKRLCNLQEICKIEHGLYKKIV